MALGFGPIGSGPIGDAPGGFSQTFFGRQKELEWLAERFERRGGAVIVSGPYGIGKTTLIRELFGRLRTRQSPMLFTAGHMPGEALIALPGRIDELYRGTTRPEVVAIDEADGLTPKDIQDVAGRLLNLKAIRLVIFIRVDSPKIQRMDTLRLAPLSDADARRTLESILGSDIPSDSLDGALLAARGLPRALSLLASLARGRSPAEVARLLRGDIYDLKHGLILPQQEIISQVRPRIIQANEALVERVRLQPEGIFSLPPRKFEELIAELLTDLGYEVELTPQTRDGGKDILAYMMTPHGRLLCLVEAKRFRHDRPVGVELVRGLYGTLMDAEASSAMLVTTSSFSPDAQSFQRRNKYKLALRDYGNVVEWVQDYGSTKRR